MSANRQFDITTELSLEEELSSRNMYSHSKNFQKQAHIAVPSTPILTSIENLRQQCNRHRNKNHKRGKQNSYLVSKLSSNLKLMTKQFLKNVQWQAYLIDKISEESKQNQERKEKIYLTEDDKKALKMIISDYLNQYKVTNHVDQNINDLIKKAVSIQKNRMVQSKIYKYQEEVIFPQVPKILTLKELKSDLYQSNKIQLNIFNRFKSHDCPHPSRTINKPLKNSQKDANEHYYTPQVLVHQGTYNFQNCNDSGFQRQQVTKNYQKLFQDYDQQIVQETVFGLRQRDFVNFKKQQKNISILKMQDSLGQRIAYEEKYKKLNEMCIDKEFHGVKNSLISQGSLNMSLSLSNSINQHQQKNNFAEEQIKLYDDGTILIVNAKEQKGYEYQKRQEWKFIESQQNKKLNGVKKNLIERKKSLNPEEFKLEFRKITQPKLLNKRKQMKAKQYLLNQQSNNQKDGNNYGEKIKELRDSFGLTYKQFNLTNQKVK